jgi:hypothetical protein
MHARRRRVLRSVFGDQKHRWRPEVIDSRDSRRRERRPKSTNPSQIYGPDSDQTRVRYLGLFPVAGGGKVYRPRTRPRPRSKRESLATDPLVVGVDFAWGGADDSVARFRKGLDARSIPPIESER